MQPIQQQGRRMPSLSSVRTRSTCCLLVSGFFTEIVQQIHSLRARGVRSSHIASASASEARVCRKSSGNSWTTPPEISLLIIVIRLSSYKRALSRCPTATALHRSCKVSDLDVGQLFAQDLDQRLHTQSAAHAFQRGHTREQDFGIDVEVAQLDQAQAGLTRESQQSLDLALAVDHAREAEQVDRAIHSGLAGTLERFFDILEGVAQRAIVGIVGLWMAGNRAHPYGIQAGIVELL